MAWTHRSEITRLWPRRFGESYIRRLIRINIADARAQDKMKAYRHV